MMPDFDIASHVVLAQGLSSGARLHEAASDDEGAPHESGRKACLRGSPCT